MTLEEAIAIFKDTYEEVKNYSFINKPVSYALYQTWKKVDGQEKNLSAVSQERENDKHEQV